MLEFAPVDRGWLIVVLACAVLAPADTLRLKSGRTIVADHVAEKNGRIVYEVSGNTYAIPKSLIESIETSDPAEAPAANPSGPPSPTPEHGQQTTWPDLPPIKAGAESTSKVVHDGQVDADALTALERAGYDGATAAGFRAAARFENSRGNRERARFYFERALMFAPKNSEVLTEYAGVLVQLGRAAEAIPFAERATRLRPSSADAFTVLGFAYYSAGRGAEAVGAWTRVLQLRPDAEVEGRIARVRRELRAESEFSRADTGHFSIRYEGATTTDGLRRKVEQALEADYRELAEQLGTAPGTKIAVALYSDQAFFDITQAPAWTGALNDGTLRIPIQGLTDMTPELARVLKHEVAHSFINQATAGHCPQWLQEGIAQLLEPRSLSATRGEHLAKLYQSGTEIPLNALEGPFVTLSPFEAVLAYDEALAAAEYLRDIYGMEQLRMLLRRIGAGASTESALRATVRGGYRDVEQGMGRYLAAKYGK